MFIMDNLVAFRKREEEREKENLEKARKAREQQEKINGSITHDLITGRPFPEKEKEHLFNQKAH